MDRNNETSGMPPPLRLDQFDTRVGETFAVVAAGQSTPLTLVLCRQIPHAGRDGGGFRLEFQGPPQPILPQATYSFPIGDERCDIFIVPVKAAADGAIIYEAIFN